MTIGEPTRLDGPVVLVDHSSRWAVDYEREAERIRRALGPVAIALEHVGSTSVPGLVAKPIVDINLAVPDSANERAYVPALEAAGYVLHVREPDWYQHRLLRGTDPAVNLHVFTTGCTEIERNVLFRDWLRTHDEERRLYAQEKRRLAARTWNYLQDYADAKTDVIEQILSRARAAATAS